VPGATVEAMVLDLATVASVRDFAERFQARGRALHLLVNCAGVIFTDPGQFQKTADGLELTFATNHVASFHLGLRLLGVLRRSAPSRIVMVSSRAHNGFPGMGGPAQFDFDNLDGEKGFDPVNAYKVSKLCMLWTTYELHRRLPDRSVTVNAVCPGFVPQTMAESQPGSRKWLFKYILPLMPGSRTLAQAVRHLAFVCTDPSLDGVSGAFLGDSKRIESNAESHDEAKARRMWAHTQALCSLDDSELEALGLSH
jgi:NAD(P)-dependent dehydrogenase (short-subunit alcohol dehydrogenase family)